MNKIFPCFFKEIHGLINFEYLWLRYICIFVFWLFGFFIFAGYSMVIFAEHDIMKMNWSERPFYFFGFFIVLGLTVCFQIIFTCLITPFILIAIFYPYFFDNILTFFNIGD